LTRFVVGSDFFSVYCAAVGVTGRNEKPIMKFKIKQSTDGQFYSVLVAGNGQTLLTSETYKAKFKCMATVKNIAKRFALPVPIIDETK